MMRAKPLFLLIIIALGSAAYTQTAKILFTGEPVEVTYTVPIVFEL